MRSIALALAGVCVACGASGRPAETAAPARGDARAFAAAFPASNLVRSTDGLRLVQASGFAWAGRSGKGGAEAAAREFLALLVKECERRSPNGPPAVAR